MNIPIPVYTQLFTFVITLIACKPVAAVSPLGKSGWQKP
jgi:hypothetical protein